MRAHVFLILASAIAMLGAAHANYWFQVGARAGIGSEFNSGSSVSIQTITPQNVSTGSPAFWVGEDLSNGAFIQAGYLIVNETASYPSYCDMTAGCTKYESIGAGQAEWFYEYFPQNYNGGAFLGEIGPAGSSGGNGTLNTYGFYSSGTRWNVVFDGNVVGSVDLGTGTSGAHSPVAFGELANATDNAAVLRKVEFSNFSVYDGQALSPVTTAYSYIGFGDGSKQGIPVPYGIQELGGRVNYFAVGSGLPMPANGTQLWGAGYTLDIESEYGGIGSSNEYMAYAKPTIAAPRVAYANDSVRAAFTGWAGSGPGSYSGPLNSTEVVIEGNITEKAQWQLQYMVNVSSAEGTAHGTGWYDAGSVASYGINATTVYSNGTSRYSFLGWSNGLEGANGSVEVSAPVSLRAEWQRQYLLSLTSDYGNVSGGGWHPEGSLVNVSVSPVHEQINGSARLTFSAWSNGERNSSFTINMSGPEALSARYVRQYLYDIQGVDAYGNRIEAGRFYANGMQINSTDWLFSGRTYNITKAYYKGVWMPVHGSVTVDSSSSAYIPMSVYNVEIYARDIFGMPVNATASLSFVNGTSAVFHTGDGGRLLVQDVPYGSATGSAGYFVMKDKVDVSTGKAVSLVFITPFDIAVLGALIAAGVLAYLYASRRMHGKGGIARETVPGME